METPSIWLRTICRKNGLPVSDNQLALLQDYVAQLLNWNLKVNLISRQDEELVWQNHILHSVSLLFKIKLRRPSVIMDLGTGGGLPGIPLKILLPDVDFLLIDSTRKKVIAVQEILRGLGLPGIEAVWGRAEDLVKQKNLLSHFDYIITRAVAPLTMLVSWSKPFLRSAPTAEQMEDDCRLSPPALIALKGGDLEEEIAETNRREKIGLIKVVDLVYSGSEEISSTGKKIVVVKL